MTVDEPSTSSLFAAFESLIASGDPVKLARVPPINFHVAGADPSRWSMVGARQPRFAPGFAAGAGTLVTCDRRGLIGLVQDQDAAPGVTGAIEVVGDPAPLAALAEALPRPWSWLEVRRGR